MNRNAENETIAAEYGYTIEATGGGGWAFFKTLPDGDYVMVTDVDGMSIDGDPEQGAWVAGRYQADENVGVCMNWGRPLRTALVLGPHLPKPGDKEHHLLEEEELAEAFQAAGLRQDPPRGRTV